MRRNVLLPFGLLAPGVLAACVTSQAAVYSQGIYSWGTTYFDVCSTSLPFTPYQYDITEISWREDEQGLTIVDIGRKAAPGDISRRCLEVVSGSEDFFLPLDSGPVKRFKSRDDPPVVKGSGDFAPVVTQFLRNRGGRTITNALPAVQANWNCGSRTNEDVFVLEGDHFAQVQNLLGQACGKPDGAIHSSAPAGGNCCSVNYTPAQIGVFLNLTRALDDRTIVSIVAAPGQK
jgi:hypothetical protein